MPEPATARVLDALENSTRVTTEVMGHLKGLEREFSSLQKSLGRQMHDLEQEMGTMNAHLDNLVRETQITNQLLKDDMTDRKEVQKERRATEKEDKAWRREIDQKQLDLETERTQRLQTIQDDNRSIAKRVGTEFWSVFRQPFGLLVAGVIGWMLFQWFYVPPQVKQAGSPPAQSQQSSERK